MTSGRAPWTRPALVVLLPAVVALAGALWSRLAPGLNDAPAEADLRRDADAVRDDFGELVRESLRIASLARRESPDTAFHYGSRGVWRERLEGAGVVDADGEFDDWAGTPAEPRSIADTPSWVVSTEGLRVRLLVATGRATDGRAGVASFVLDSPLGDLPFDDLLGARARVVLEVEFLDARAPLGELDEALGTGDARFRDGDPPTLYAALRAPNHTPLAILRIQAVDPAHRASEIRSMALAVAAGLFALLLGTVFRWGSSEWTFPGLLRAWAAIVLGRAALSWTDAPGWLLPREIGSASVFGSPRAAGLAASPADLLLTSVALLLALLALAGYARRVSRHGSGGGRRAVAVALAGTVAATAAVALVSVMIARHSTAPGHLFEYLAQPLGQVLILAGLVVVLIAAAEITAQLVTLLLGKDAGAPPGRFLVGIAMLPLAFVSSAVFLVTLDRADRDRLESEFALHVLEQSARREVSLRAAVADAADTEVARDAVLAGEGEADAYAAYRLWVSGDLFHLGYKSSIDLYDADGEPVSHFGFDLPGLDETILPPPTADEVDLVAEGFPATLAVEQRVLHAEAPIVQDGVAVGTVVGHVLDEPDNIPFLPTVGPYLAALGPGARPRSGRTPDYVLYDERGRVMISTLRRPPTPDAALREAALREDPVEMFADGSRYEAFALPDDGRLHLLLLRSRPLLDRMAIFAKLVLISAGLLAVATFVRRAVRDRGFEFMVRGVRESFYHKLLVTLLLASLIPLIGLAVFLGGYFEGRVADQLANSAAQVIRVVQRVIGEYAVVQSDEEDPVDEVRFDDEILYWLRRVVQQEIHLYADGRLEASSKRELFSSGLLPVRLPGEVHHALIRDGLPYTVVGSRLGPSEIPVAYARVELPGSDRDRVAAVPLILEQEETERAAERVEEMLVLTTVLLAVLVIAGTAVIARSVARPVRELVRATARIAAGDYSARLEPPSEDEVAELVRKFNAMAEALADQRADLERRRDYMQALLTNATTGVLSTDADGTIVTVNPAAERLLGGDGEPPKAGENLIEAVARRRELEPLAASLESLAASSGEPAEVDLERDGEAVRLRCVRVSLPEPTTGRLGSLLLVDDVTDLMRSNQLAAWAEMAQAIAHEIKNPLTPIQLSTEHLERLLEDADRVPSDEVDRCLETIIKQVHALREIASEFSAYAKLPSLAPEPTDPVTLMRDVMAPYRAAPHPRVEIDEAYEDAPVILADRRVIARALVNLVENALQAMQDGGRLTVRVGPGERGNGAVLVVEDTGPGLAPDVRARLFEPYFSTKSSGTGLGLAIARRAVEAHGGHIEVSSGRGEGTVFRIRLPGVAVPSTR